LTFKRLKLSALALVAFAASAAWPASAGATFPGGNGRVLVYTSGGIVLQTMNPDGSGLQSLSSAVSWSPDQRVSWSPDGRSILLMTGLRDSADIAVMDADGGPLRTLVGGSTSDRSPAWAPDGGQIVFDRVFGPTSDRRPVPYVAASDGSDARPLFATSPCSGKLAVCNPRPLWSAAGMIALESDRGGTSQLWAMNADGTAARELSAGTGTGKLLDWDWSPDGTRLAFVRADASAPSPTMRLYVVESSGSGLVQVAELGPFYGDRPSPGVSWSPDGTKLMFGEVRLVLPAANVLTNLFMTNSDGSGLSQVTTSGDIYQPGWRPVPKPPGSGGRNAPKLRISKSAVRLSRRGDAAIRVTCVAPGIGGVCAGTLRLVAARRVACGSKRPRRPVAFGSRRFTIAGKRTAAVKVRLSRKARSIVACRRKVGVRATASVARPTGGVATFRSTLVLRAR
jgi:Tol biopolymer transport system component